MKLFSLILPSALCKVDYSGYKVFRSEWTDPIISQTVYEFLSKSESANLWAPDDLENVFDTMSADFMISESEAAEIQRKFSGNGIETRVMIEDAGKLIREQKEAKKGKVGRSFSYEEYLEYDELEEWITDTAEEYSQYTELVELDTTAGGRTLYGLHMGDKNHTGNKKKIFMGRE